MGSLLFWYLSQHIVTLCLTCYQDKKYNDTNGLQRNFNEVYEQQHQQAGASEVVVEESPIGHNMIIYFWYTNVFLVYWKCYCGTIW